MNFNCWLIQDPGAWGLDSMVARVAKAAIQIKYKILPYIYSTFFNAYLQVNM